MANYETGLDILVNVLSRSDELEIGTAEREEEAKTYIQAAYLSVITEGYPWPWARHDPPGVLITNRERTGAVIFTQGSDTITFSVAPDADLTNRKIYADGEEVIYRIEDHDANVTTATLDSIFLGASGTYNTHVFQDEYTLTSDLLRPVTHKFLKPADGMPAVELIGQDELAGKTSSALLWSGADSPRYCAFIGTRKIRIWPWTTTSKRFEYAYIYHPGNLNFTGDDADTLIIQPGEDRVVVSLIATGNILVDKNDDRAQIFLDAAVSKINSMKRLHQSKSRARAWVMPGNNVSTGR